MVQEPVMDPHVVRSLKDFEVTEVRGGQHHALALTQVPRLTLLVACMSGFCLIWLRQPCPA